MSPRHPLGSGPRREGEPPPPTPRRGGADPVLAALLPYLLFALVALPALGIYAYVLRDLPGLRVAHPFALLLALALPLAAVVLFHLGRRRMGGMLFSRVGEVRRLRLGFWAQIASLPGALRLAALGLVVVALLGPQSTTPDRVDVEGIDIVICLDMSNSMEEGDLVPDRLSAAKRVIDHFIRRRQLGLLGRGDRIGMVVFGREAYTYAPLTFDYDALRGLVRDLRLGFIDGRGTAIGNALGVALNRLRHSDAKSKVIILLTDGDNNSGNISPPQAARFARTLGVKVYTILMGQNEESDPLGRRLPLMRRYPVNPKLLEEIATVTGGSPYLATDSQALETRFHQILEELERSKLRDASVSRTPLFPLFVWPALALLGLELLLSLTRLRKFP
jgi:Ca-activated chloride channel family protein